LLLPVPFGCHPRRACPERSRIWESGVAVCICCCIVVAFVVAVILTLSVVEGEGVRTATAFQPFFSKFLSPFPTAARPQKIKSKKAENFKSPHQARFPTTFHHNPTTFLPSKNHVPPPTFPKTPFKNTSK
jgi:hypothetical protein